MPANKTRARAHDLAAIHARQRGPCPCTHSMPAAFNHKHPPPATVFFVAKHGAPRAPTDRRKDAAIVRQIVVIPPPPVPHASRPHVRVLRTQELVPAEAWVGGEQDQKRHSSRPGSRKHKSFESRKHKSFETTTPFRTLSRDHRSPPDASHPTSSR